MERRGFAVSLSTHHTGGRAEGIVADRIANAERVIADLGGQVVSHYIVGVQDGEGHNRPTMVIVGGFEEGAQVGVEGAGGVSRQDQEELSPHEGYQQMLCG